MIDALSELSLSERSTVVQETAIRFDSTMANAGVEGDFDSSVGGPFAHCPPGPRGDKCHQYRGPTRKVGVVLTPLPRESQPADSYPAPPSVLDARCNQKFHLRTIECW